jgi:putative ABC transport system permease protein
VTLETMDWLGEPRGYNIIDLLVNVQPYDEEHITGVGKLVREKMEHSGYFVGGVSIHRPGEHPLASLFNALSLILLALGIIALPLSGFLVINIITALITQQVRQIGVMKAVGATSRQVTGMYVIMVAIFGLLSLVVAMPCGMLAAWRFVGFLAYFLNFTPASFSIPLEVILLEVAVGLLVPVIAAFYPIVMGTRVTVREAISNYGLSQVERKGWIDRLMARIRGLPRPLALSLRNTFRRRVRLFLTLATLTLACSIFISILSVGTSLNSTLDEILRFYGFDMQILLSQSYRMDRILSETSQVPGVVAVEGWGQVAAYQVLNDGTQGQLFYVLAPPADSQVLRPVMAEGRWLQPDDENALVVTPGFIQAHPEAQVGSELVLKINEQKSTWKIVGSAKMMGSSLYANYAYMARLTNDAGAAQILVVSTEKHDSASQAEVAKALSDRLNSAGLKVQTTITMENQRQQNIVFFNILTTLLMAMAALLALVGGLGLMGMMSINVLERTREIGVMRAIGATSKTILQIFLTEGILIGWISAALGIILSLPLSQLISYSIGVTLMQTPLAFTFSVNGVLIWLILVTVLAAAATYLPAKDAARLTVRDVLAYE